MEQDKKPLVTSFYAVAIAAEKQGYSGGIFCIICDSDFNRAWLPRDTASSKIMYFSPCSHVTERLKMYGVPMKKILTVGFPLPKENIGTKTGMEILKKDLSSRLTRLDPKKRFRVLHKGSLKYYLGSDLLSRKANTPFVVTFAVGGAGAQVDIGKKIVSSLKDRVLAGEIRINLVAGVREKVAKEFTRHVIYSKLTSQLGSGINIIHDNDMQIYFNKFNAVLRQTDVLWTKPSELTFYPGLAIPIITAPPIGAHEVLNYRWLRKEAVGIPQEDPRYTHQWLIDYWKSGLLAEMAWSGFLKIRKMGTYKIEEYLASGKFTFGKEIFER